MNTLEVFRNLPGIWQFNRTILNHGSVSGHAHFIPIQPFLLHYKEQGVFTTQDKEFQASREYSYYYEAKTDKISVSFIENGRPTYLFHELNFAAPHSAMATGEHLCNQDMYYATYTFIDPNTFRINYRVEGPTKNYISDTLFRRDAQ